MEHGFDFHGQNVRRYPNGKLLIKPSKKNVGTSRMASDKIKPAHGMSNADLIDTLNPMVRGSTNYHGHVQTHVRTRRLPSLIVTKALDPIGLPLSADYPPSNRWVRRQSAV